MLGSVEGKEDRELDREQTDRITARASARASPPPCHNLSPGVKKKVTV